MKMGAMKFPECTDIRRRHYPGRIGMLAFTCVLSTLPICARANDSPPSQLDPSELSTDSKLSPTVSQVLLRCLADFSAQRLDDAAKELATASSLPNRTPHDNFRIDEYELILDFRNKDYPSAATLIDKMLAFPDITDTDRNGLFRSAVGVYAMNKDLWRSIQFGQRLLRAKALGVDTAATLARVFLADGFYADAEGLSQAALSSVHANDEQKKLLSNILEKAQIAQGERDQSIGESLLGAVLAGAAAGVAQGLSGQQVAPAATGLPPADQRRAQAQQAERLAQQHGAAEVLSQSDDALRLVYSDLIARSAALSDADKKRAKQYYDSASDAYGRQDFATAQADLQQDLAIDPANASADYYYADCLARGSNNQINLLQVVDYLARALMLDRTGDAGSQARQALQGIASPSQSAEQN